MVNPVVSPLLGSSNSRARWVRRVPVGIEILSQDSRIDPDLPATADMLILERDDVLAVLRVATANFADRDPVWIRDGVRCIARECNSRRLETPKPCCGPRYARERPSRYGRSWSPASRPAEPSVVHQKSLSSRLRSWRRRSRKGDGPCRTTRGDKFLRLRDSFWSGADYELGPCCRRA